jgi:hypothetical protein
MPTDYEIVQAMERFGGSFVRALAAACHCADPVNFAKIRAAFPDLWKKYAEMHEQAKQRERDWSQA